ncbi:MAG TPA: hypothetical protein DCR87_07100 [Acidobacteria bacterium]|nr:hypothetical protein [Acidobacteriota bacterium]
MAENEAQVSSALDRSLPGSLFLGSGFSPAMTNDNSWQKHPAISAGQLGPTAGLIATNSFMALYYQCRRAKLLLSGQ